MIESILYKLSEVSERFKEIEELLSKPEVINNQEEYVSLSKEYADLSPVIAIYEEYLEVESTIAETSKLIRDPDEDIKFLAESEVVELKEKLSGLDKQLRELLIPKDPDDSKNVFLEIRAGTGGDEAALFAKDLFRMYSRLAERNKWNIEQISCVCVYKN